MRKCFAIIPVDVYYQKKEVQRMKKISINSHVLEKSLLVDDPDVKRTFTDASGNERHIRIFSDPVRLKSYIKKHPEGLIIAGTGVFFFREPVLVTSAMISFDENGNADIRVKEGAEDIEKQLSAIDDIRSSATKALFGV